MGQTVFRFHVHYKGKKKSLSKNVKAYNPLEQVKKGAKIK